MLLQQYERPRGFAVLLSLGDPMEAERLCNALAERRPSRFRRRSGRYAMAGLPIDSAYPGRSTVEMSSERSDQQVDQVARRCELHCERRGTRRDMPVGVLVGP